MNAPFTSAAPKGAPTSPNAIPAGLASLTQHTQPSGGAPSEDMYQVMARAKEMSDRELADVLSGKSIAIPQFAALTAAMGRKSLRTAVQGLQAQQAKMPTERDKALAELQSPLMAAPQAPVMAAAGGGLASLPAGNMDSVDMADGGIVAFAGEGDSLVPEPSGFDKKIWNALKDKFSEWNQPWFQGGVNATPEEIRGALTGKNLKPNYRTAAPITGSSFTPDQLDAIARGQGVFPEGSAALSEGLPLAAAVAEAAKTPPKKTSIGGIGPSKDAFPTDDFKSYVDMIKKNSGDYLSKLEGLSDKQREGIAQLRKEGGGEALMQLAAALFGSPNMSMALSKGLPLVASTAASSRKEQREIERAANEMDFNLAKAQQAADKGDIEGALNYKKLADDAAYRKEQLRVQMAQINQPTDLMRNLSFLGDPEMMNRFKSYEEAKSLSKAGTTYDIGKATDDFNKVVSNPFSDQAKQLKKLGISTPSQYQQYVMSQGTMGGAPVKFLGFEK